MPARTRTRRGQSATLLFKLAIENMAQGLFMLDANQKIIVVNPQFLDIYGLPGSIIKVGASARDIVEQSILAGNYPGLSLDAAWARASNRLAAKQPWRIQQRLGNGKVVEIAYAPMRDGGWVTTHLDVTERQNAEDRLAYLAQHDALTGLANRARALDVLARHIEHKAPVSVLCLDLDRFKAVNDTLGHAHGDDLLQQVAARLRTCLRETDTIARLGGDEFAIVKPPGNRRLDDARLARRIIAAIGAPFALGDHRVQIGASIGIATASRGAATAKTLLRQADTALYRAKAEGRGTFRVFDPDMDRRLEQRRVLEVELRDAMAQGALELHYQPIIDLQTGAITAFEALPHWNHPTRGLIAPHAFIPVAEETGLIDPIGAWVLRTACSEAQNWPGDIAVAVNLSQSEFGQGTCVARVQSALHESGLHPGRLDCEIGEAALLENQADGTLNRFRSMGVSLTLDRFGSGSASLGHLRRFPFDRLKIDRCFVRDLMHTNDARPLVAAIAALGRSLGMQVSAEGVHTRAQLDILQAVGCRRAQGRVFSEPMTAGAISGAAPFDDWLDHPSATAGAA